MMRELVEIPDELPSDLEARIEKVAAESGKTREEIIICLVKLVLDAADDPSIDGNTLAQQVRKALKK